VCLDVGSILGWSYQEVIRIDTENGGKHGRTEVDKSRVGTLLLVSLENLGRGLLVQLNWFRIELLHLLALPSQSLHHHLLLLLVRLILQLLNGSVMKVL
jgi:hypothetical protein